MPGGGTSEPKPRRSLHTLPFFFLSSFLLTGFPATRPPVNRSLSPRPLPTAPASADSSPHPSPFFRAAPSVPPEAHSREPVSAPSLAVRVRRKSAALGGEGGRTSLTNASCPTSPRAQPGGELWKFHGRFAHASCVTWGGSSGSQRENYLANSGENLLARRSAPTAGGPGAQGRHGSRGPRTAHGECSQDRYPPTPVR